MSVHADCHGPTAFRAPVFVRSPLSISSFAGRSLEKKPQCTVSRVAFSTFAPFAGEGCKSRHATVRASEVRRMILASEKYCYEFPGNLSTSDRAFWRNIYNNHNYNLYHIVHIYIVYFSGTFVASTNFPVLNIDLLTYDHICCTTGLLQLASESGLAHAGFPWSDVHASRYPVHSGRRPRLLSATSGAPPCSCTTSGSGSSLSLAVPPGAVSSAVKESLR